MGWFTRDSKIKAERRRQEENLLALIDNVEALINFADEEVRERVIQSEQYKKLVRRYKEGYSILK